MLHRTLRVSLLAAVLIVAVRAAADDKLAGELASLNVTVASGDEQKALTTMVADAIRERRYTVSDQVTAEWQKVKNKDDWQKFLTPKLQALEASLGQFPSPPKDLRLHVTSTIAGEGYRIDCVVFESRPGLWVTANLYRPEKPPVSMPGFLICHAHHTPKADGELQDMGMTWARAGCLVLIMDQLGHGERRQHPFHTADDYANKYRVSRQDYHFRFDSGVQLHLLGDSLMGWMAYDLRRGVDVLLAQKGIDPKRIILLGSVAGGGDPAAVVAALDPRIACVAPFNFGSPSPKPQYPYPLETPPRWNWIGGGSWESTRNLTNCGNGGFTPWVLVAAAAPRHLVFAHEFGWFAEGDPAWQRLQAIYKMHDAADRLSFTHGKGDVTKRPPEGTHCNHIGALHRVMMHDAFKRWFQIDMNADKEYSQRLESAKLRCWTPELKAELKPRTLMELMNEEAAARMARARAARAGKSPAEQRRLLQAQWTKILGNVEPAAKREAKLVSTTKSGNVAVSRVMLTLEPGISVPVVLLVPETKNAKTPVVVIVGQEGKAELLPARRQEIAELLEAGTAVCLPDVRGTGESGLGKARDYRSNATALSSSQLMLGEPLVAGQLRDLRGVLAWLRSRPEIDAAKIALWGDALAKPNEADANFKIPHDPDAVMPPGSEPLGGLLALLTALYEDDVRAVYVRGGLGEFRSLLDSHLVLVPHDVIVPGLLTTGDLPDVAAALAPRPVRLDGLVDGLNRRLPEAAVKKVCAPALAAYAGQGLTIQAEPTSPARWLISQASGGR